MLKIFTPKIFADTDLEARAQELASKTYEFSDFLVNQLDVTDVGARYSAKATFHDGCHGLRELGIKEAPRQLL